MGSILNEINISGKGLMSGEDCTVTIFPSDTNGIKFFPTGIEQPIIANAENVVSTQNCVVLANKFGQIQLVEHFLAACAFCGIDSLDVCMSGNELPILDGSAKKWVELFTKAGFERTFCGATIDKPISYVNGDTVITLLPADELSVTYLLDFNHPDLKQKWVKTDFKNPEEIIEARTFGYLKDLEKFQRMGLAKGVDLENTLGLTDDGYTAKLRSEFEPIKHKILDLTGDLKLADINLTDLKVAIIAKQAGHSSHVEMAKILKRELTIGD